MFQNRRTGGTKMFDQNIGSLKQNRMKVYMTKKDKRTNPGKTKRKTNRKMNRKMKRKTNRNARKGGIKNTIVGFFDKLRGKDMISSTEFSGITKYMMDMLIQNKTTNYSDDIRYFVDAKQHIDPKDDPLYHRAKIYYTNRFTLGYYMLKNTSDGELRDLETRLDDWASSIATWIKTMQCGDVLECSTNTDECDTKLICNLKKSCFDKLGVNKLLENEKARNQFVCDTQTDLHNRIKKDGVTIGILCMNEMYKQIESVAKKIWNSTNTLVPCQTHDIV